MILERPEAVLSDYSLFYLDETPTSSVDADYKGSFFFLLQVIHNFPNSFRTAQHIRLLQFHLISNSDARSIIFLFANVL